LQGYPEPVKIDIASGGFCSVVENAITVAFENSAITVFYYGNG
jgi:hypothetical protein